MTNERSGGMRDIRGGPKKERGAALNGTESNLRNTVNPPDEGWRNLRNVRRFLKVRQPFEIRRGLQ